MYLKLTKDGVFKGRLFAMTSVSAGSKVQYCFKNYALLNYCCLIFYQCLNATKL